jgi:hypothetical protein
VARKGSEMLGAWDGITRARFYMQDVPGEIFGRLEAGNGDNADIWEQWNKCGK